MVDRDGDRVATHALVQVLVALQLVLEQLQRLELLSELGAKVLGQLRGCRVCHRKAPKWHRCGTLTARSGGRSRDGALGHSGRETPFHANFTPDSRSFAAEITRNSRPELDRGHHDMPAERFGNGSGTPSARLGNGSRGGWPHVGCLQRRPETPSQRCANASTAMWARAEFIGPSFWTT